MYLNALDKSIKFHENFKSQTILVLQIHIHTIYIIKWSIFIILVSIMRTNSSSIPNSIKFVIFSFLNFLITMNITVV